MKKFPFPLILLTILGIQAMALPAQVLLFNPTAGDTAVDATDLNAITTGGTWTTNFGTAIDISAFRNDGAAGTDYGYVMSDSSGDNPVPTNTYVQVNLSTPIDLTTQQIELSFDMASHSTTRLVAVFGYSSGTTQLFRYNWTNGASGLLSGATAEGVTNLHGANYNASMGNGNYDPSIMKTFTVTISGTGAGGLTYAAEDADNTVNGTVLGGGTTFSSIRWMINGTADPASIWLDNVSITVIPEPGTAALLLLGGLGLAGTRLRRS